MKFSIMNLGCKVNAFEAESIARELEKRGWQRVGFEDPADAALIFTCAVTNIAAQKSRKMMHRAKRTNPDAVIAVVGCYAEVNDGLLNDADLIVGTAHKHELPDLLESYLKDPKQVVRLKDLDHMPFQNMISTQYENHARAYLKIQDGCNQFCTFCVIPYVRGRERSMDPDLVVEEAKRIAENYKEIVLTGIHTGRYGREYDVSLASLMKRILRAVKDLSRLRISSIEVTELTDEFVELFCDEQRIARHLHIPLQSGSDGVLRRMHRPYDTDYYYARIEEIRRLVPDAAVSCDLIVGFPGETEQEFQETLAFIRKCRFSFLHVFPYSLREGTRAAEMPCQIDPQVKKHRVKQVISLSDELKEAYAKTWLDKEAEVIFEKEKDGYTEGYTSQYVPVKVAGKQERGSFGKIRIKDYHDGYLYGERE